MGLSASLLIWTPATAREAAAAAAVREKGRKGQTTRNNSLSPI